MRCILGFCVLLTLAWAVPVTEMLGQDYTMIIKTYGFPSAIFPVRQSRADKDDVVFAYAYAYMYLYNNRCYRVFFSSQYAAEILPGVKIGSSKAALTKALGQKYTLENEGLVWKKDTYTAIAKMAEDNTLKGFWFITKVEK